MKTFCFFATLLLSALPVAAGGQSRTALAVAFGPSLPVGKLRETQAAGTDFTVGLVRGSDQSPLGVRLDFAYDKLKGKTLNGVKQPEVTTTSGALNLVFSFSGYTLKPYVLAGGGAFKMGPKASPIPSKIRFGFDFGLGFTKAVGGKAIFLESRLNSVAQKNAKPLRYAPIVIGFLF